MKINMFVRITENSNFLSYDDVIANDRNMQDRPYLHSVTSQCIINPILYMSKVKFKMPAYIQSNQKMHDLYATKHISEMVLADAFWAV